MKRYIETIGNLQKTNMVLVVEHPWGPNRIEVSANKSKKANIVLILYYSIYIHMYIHMYYVHLYIYR